MPRLVLDLLGGFQARVDAGPSLVFPTRKGQALIAYLALRPGLRQPRDKLAALLWGDTAEEQARNSLRQTLFNLRKTLAGAARSLLVEGETLALSPASVEVDVHQFERQAADGSPGALERAASLYRGDLLDGMNLREPAFEDWLTVERERLRGLVLDVLTKLLRHQTAAGAIEAAIQTATRLLAVDPLQEVVHRTLMRLYVRQGRRGAALKQFQTCADLMRRELAVDVEVETRRLYDDILERRAIDLTAPDATWLEQARPAARGRPAILVADDDRVTRTLLERFLTDAGYEVVTAADGAEALIQLGKRRFDVVLSDISMPTLDGLQLLEVMSQKKIDTPAIFVTGMPGSQLEVQGFKLGAADFIRKPIDKDVLLMRVRNVMSRATRSRP